MSIPLGPPPRPLDGPQLASRVIDELRRHPDVVENPDAARVEAERIGDTIERLHVWLTGVRFRVPDELLNPEATGAPTDPGQPSTQPSPATTAEMPVAGSRGVARSVGLLAQPASVEGRDVWVDGAFNDLPVRWIETVDQVVLELDEPTPDRPLHGHLRAEVGIADLEGLVEDVVNRGLDGRGAVSGLSLALARPSRGEYLPEAGVTMRLGLLRGRVRASARVTIDEAMVLRVDRVRLSSANLLLWLPLLVANRKLDQHEVEPFPLRRPEIGVMVRDLDVRLDQRLRVAATFGP
ncbi:hypothetical protein [Aestuariimicrobium ganziense]|uniref:hypothetical protein n=1 Tax=Aestuariimicrobium ganziense TaxID=2773677 RepID=UPI0019406A3D|nr:hypothetical protein [Aestuariimicrobium ganziense]